MLSQIVFLKKSNVFMIHSFCTKWDTQKFCKISRLNLINEKIQHKTMFAYHLWSLP